MLISSSSNKHIKEIIALMKKPKFRNEKKLFVVEGSKIFVELSLDIINTIYVSETYFENAPLEIKDKIKSKKYYLISDKVFKVLSDTINPQGILAICRQNEFVLSDIIEKSFSLILLENLQDPGNLGTIFRTAEAANIDAIILDKQSVDIYNPKLVRSAMGAISRLKYLYVDDLKEVVKILQKDNFKIYAAHLFGKKYYDKYTYPEKTAFLIGNESKGLSDDIANLADDLVKIPIYNKAESLNAAIATGVLIYELDRQKRNK